MTTNNKRSNPVGASNRKDVSSQKSPFNLKVTKSKFNILNKQVAGAKGRPTQSHARALQKRTQTILPELIRRGRTGNFIDKRFGERNPTLSSEEKMLERFSRERIRSNKKKSIYNLNDDAVDKNYSDTLTLTHRGKNLDDIEEYSDPEHDDDVQDERQYRNSFGADIIERDYLSNNDSTGERRTKSEIMQEVIAKSKKYKLERQKAKEENEALCDDIDTEFSSLLTSNTPALETRQGSDRNTQKYNTVDDYDEAVRMMTFDRRAQPSDRTKTSEEIKKEAEEKLAKKLASQKERLTMPKGRATSSSDDDDDVDINEDYYNGEEEEEERDNFPSFDDEKALTNSEKSIKGVMSRVKILLDQVLSSIDLVSANMAYSELISISQTNSVIPVAHVIRKELSVLVDSIKAAKEKGKEQTFPDKKVLILFHLIGCIFSTSDYHHIVATPAIFLINYYFTKGRILKKSHLLGALFLIQTFFSYTVISKRISPECFGLLYPLLFHTFTKNSSSSTPSPYFPTDRLVSRPVYEFIRGLDTTTDSSTASESEKDFQPEAIKLIDLINIEGEQGEDYLTKERLVCFLLHLISTAVHQYGEENGNTCSAFLEIFEPMVKVLQSSPLTVNNTSLINELLAIIEANKTKRRPLELLKRKPVAIPSLIPDIKGDGPASKEERAHQILKRAYKRELKGAKRELRRDSAFIANQNLKRRLDSDKKYKENLDRIIGSISNESTQAANKHYKRSNNRK